jgi:predicted transcriptional regulator
VVLTKSELEIMDVIWAAGQPLSRSDLLENSQNKSWKDSSVHILLNGMLQKGVIREAGFVKRSKTYGRTFEPTLTREEYYAITVLSRKHKPSVVGLIEALLRQEKLPQEELEQIKKLVNEL